MKRKKASKGILIDVALLLLCLLCITTCLSSGIMARYTTNAGASKNGRTAGFAVSAKAEPIGEDAMEYRVKIRNESEIAVRYSLKLTFDTDKDLTDIVKAKIDNTEYGIKNGNEILIENIGDIAFGRDAVITFNLIVEDGAIDSDIDFETIVRFEQID